jgi:uncharacterized protein
VSDFDWDEANIAHIRQHGVEPYEAEDALTIAAIDIDSYIVDGELRFESVGQTASARILKIISTGRGQLIRVVTAFDASAATKRSYLRSMVNDEKQ